MGDEWAQTKRLPHPVFVDGLNALGAMKFQNG